MPHRALAGGSSGALRREALAGASLPQGQVPACPRTSQPHVCTHAALALPGSRCAVPARSALGIFCNQEDKSAAQFPLGSSAPLPSSQRMGGFPFLSPFCFFTPQRVSSGKAFQLTRFPWASPPSRALPRRFTATKPQLAPRNSAERIGDAPGDPLSASWLHGICWQLINPTPGGTHTPPKHPPSSADCPFHANPARR